MRNRFWIVVIGLHLISQFVCAAETQFPKDAYYREDFAVALKSLRPLAELGDADAQSKLGIMYAKGYGVTQDFAQAVSWFRKAVEQGHAGAQFNLAGMFSRGQGVKHDYKEALVLLEKSGGQGYVDAQMELGWKFTDGVGVAQSFEQALLWYQKAALQGNAEAQVTVGVMYESGRGVVKDEAQAETWYRTAAKQGNSEALAWVQKKTEQRESEAKQRHNQAQQESIRLQREANFRKAQASALDAQKSGRFSSFKQAYEILEPIVEGRNYDFLRSPMSFRGKVIVVTLRVRRILGSEKLLMSYGGISFPVLNAATNMYCGYIPPAYSGSREFVDDESVDVIGEVTGTFKYEGVADGVRTVPMITIYGIRPSP